jgi:hypothetical protein
LNAKSAAVVPVLICRVAERLAGEKAAMRAAPSKPKSRFIAGHRLAIGEPVTSWPQ